VCALSISVSLCLPPPPSPILKYVHICMLILSRARTHTKLLFLSLSLSRYPSVIPKHTHTYYAPWNTQHLRFFADCVLLCSPKPTREKTDICTGQNGSRDIFTEMCCVS
jgi:hypothetical protein